MGMRTKFTNPIAQVINMRQVLEGLDLFKTHGIQRNPSACLILLVYLMGVA